MILDNKSLNRYKSIKYDKEHGAFLPKHKIAELELYEKMYKKEESNKRKKAILHNRKIEM